MKCSHCPFDHELLDKSDLPKGVLIEGNIRDGIFCFGEYYMKVKDGKIFKKKNW